MLGKIGDAIIFILNIIMCWTQCMTWLYTVKEVIFDNELFGSFATQKVMKEMITKHARRIFFCMQKLQKYQQGFLPCWTSIQNCAAELHQLGQDLITFEKVSSDLGEMYQFHHEKLTRHILSTFQLDEITRVTWLRVTWVTCARWIAQSFEFHEQIIEGTGSLIS